MAGAWVLLLDPEHYSHGAQFHLTLLALAGFVFFYAALDKVFSPAWGLKGTGLPALRMADHGPGLGLVQRANRALLRVIPGALSVGTILTEFLLAAVAVVPRLWRVGLFTGLTFGRVDRVSLAARTLRLGSPCRGARLPARRRLQLEDGVCAGMRRMSAKPGDSAPP